MKALVWNCWVGNKRVGLSLRNWIKQHNPDVIFLSEARTHRKALSNIKGYALYQAKPVKKAKSGLVNDRGDSAILVRKDLVVQRARIARARLTWLVRSHNRRHTPREAQIVVLNIDGRKWRLRADHFPTGGFDSVNGEAFRDNAKRARRWLNLGKRKRTVSVIAGDLNEKAPRIKAFFGRKDREIAGEGIDLTIVQHGHVTEYKTLGKGGSDAHHAHLLTIEPKVN